MRNIKYIVIHCTATPQGTKISSILNYWKNVLKWKNPGYHFVVDKDGNICKLRDITQTANGVKNYNKYANHIAYIGGVDNAGKPKDNRTLKQKDQLLFKVRELKRMFPNAVILGHRDFPNVQKACPSFDAKKEYENIFDFI